ncbi:MAG TPA: tripartite tricarboxylate transporter substrate binding protein [Burkholderiales bacterium]|nr:tripartite tricarboxylate transporter substrate binding protein [Burkholderiales bacterium]
MAGKIPPKGVRVLARCLLLAAAVSCAAPAAGAETGGYPTKPIRLVIGFTPGGVPDITARLIAAKLTENWKQQVIVDNRPGAGGTLAARTVAGANPDGYTLLSVSNAHAVAAAIYEKLPYDTLKDFAGITMTASGPALLLVSPALGVKSAKELIAAARAKPGQFNFSSAGIGSGTHFAGELFKSMAGIDVVHVPFKGIPEAITETMTGRVQFFLSPLASAIGLVKEGKVPAVGVTSRQRVPQFPDLPTVAESGLPGYYFEFWYGLLAPARTPRPIVLKLNREVGRILNDPEVRGRLVAMGAEPAPTTPEQFERFIAQDVATLAKLARAAGIKAQ